MSDLGETASDVRGATGPVKVAVAFLVCEKSTVSPGSALQVHARRGLGKWNGGLTDFKVDALHVASGLGDVDLLLILRVCNDGEDLGRELERVAVVVLRFGRLARCLVERRAAAR